MTLTRASAFVAVSAVACAAVGTAIGWLIGAFAPDAYRGLLGWYAPDEFSAVEFGIGVGLVQGLLVGLVVGILLVAIVTWHDIRTKTGNPD